MIETPKGTSWIDLPDIVKGIVTALAGALIAAIIAFARWLKGAFWGGLVEELSDHYATKNEHNALRKRVHVLERRAGLVSDDHHRREGDL
jgi:cell division protein FtsX